MVQRGQSWNLPPPDFNDAGEPTIHSIADRLGCIRPNSDIALPQARIGFPENTQETQQLISHLESLENSQEQEDHASSPPQLAFDANVGRRASWGSAQDLSEWEDNIQTPDHLPLNTLATPEMNFASPMLASPMLASPNTAIPPQNNFGGSWSPPTPMIPLGPGYGTTPNQSYQPQSFMMFPNQGMPNQGMPSQGMPSQGMHSGIKQQYVLGSQGMQVIDNPMISPIYHDANGDEGWNT